MTIVSSTDKVCFKPHSAENPTLKHAWVYFSLNKKIWSSYYKTRKAENSVTYNMVSSVRFPRSRLWVRDLRACDLLRKYSQERLVRKLGRTGMDRNLSENVIFWWSLAEGNFSMNPIGEFLSEIKTVISPKTRKLGFQKLYEADGKNANSQKL